LGGVVSQTPGVPVFLQGIFVLGPLTRYLYEAGTHGKHLPDTVFPNFWLSLGYVAIGLVITYALMFVISGIEVQLLRRFNPEIESGQSGVSFLIGALLGPVVGILLLLMYSKYVALSLRGHV
jgi:hypothetical protein